MIIDVIQRSQMNQHEPEWALSQVKNVAETMLFRKKLAAKTEAKCKPNTHVMYLTFGCKNEPAEVGFYTSEDGDTFEHIDANDIGSLESKTGAELVAVVSAWKVRDYIWYSDNPDLFLESATYLRSTYSQFDIGCECNPDQNWSAYEDLPPSESAG